MPESNVSVVITATSKRQRNAVFGRLCDSLSTTWCCDVIAHDHTRPGTDGAGRFAIAAIGNDGKLIEVDRVTSRDCGETVESHLSEGWEILGLWDLDTLGEGDTYPSVVEYQGETWHVHGLHHFLGEPTGKWTLKKPPNDRRRTSYDWAQADPSECDWYGWKDERLPVKYAVAEVIRRVVFNTVPS
jgi:hypothetical protein